MLNELAPRPSQPDRPPHGLVSLWDMQRFKAKAFYDSVRYLERLLVVAEHVITEEGKKQNVGEPTATNINQELGKFIVGCQILEAPLSVKAGKRLQDSLKELTISQLLIQCKDLSRRFQDELEESWLFIIPDQDKSYYNNPVSLFGDKVAANFPTALPDLEEAGKCLALDRPTAASFHLMRALEVPLQALGKTLLPNDPKPNWDPVLRKIDAELKLPHGQRTIKGDVQFYAHVSNHMNAIKLAWRNRVNHIDEIVPPEKAREIFASTRSLMIYLAENFSSLSATPPPP